MHSLICLALAEVLLCAWGSAGVGVGGEGRVCNEKSLVPSPPRVQGWET